MAKKKLSAYEQDIINETNRLNARAASYKRKNEESIKRHREVFAKLLELSPFYELNISEYEDPYDIEVHRYDKFGNKMRYDEDGESTLHIVGTVMMPVLDLEIIFTKGVPEGKKVGVDVREKFKSDQDNYKLFLFGNGFNPYQRNKAYKLVTTVHNIITRAVSQIHKQIEEENFKKILAEKALKDLSERFVNSKVAIRHVWNQSGEITITLNNGIEIIIEYEEIDNAFKYSLDTINVPDDIDPFFIVGALAKNNVTPIKMNFEEKHIDELLEMRQAARGSKDWALSDEIRAYLDAKLVFVFDHKWGQEVYHTPECYFNKTYTYKEKDGKIVVETVMERIARLKSVTFPTKRSFVEWKIKDDIRSTSNLEAWIYTANEKAKHDLNIKH